MRLERIRGKELETEKCWELQLLNCEFLLQPYTDSVVYLTVGQVGLTTMLTRAIMVFQFFM